MIISAPSGRSFRPGAPFPGEQNSYESNLYLKMGVSRFSRVPLLPSSPLGTSLNRVVLIDGSNVGVVSSQSRLFVLLTPRGGQLKWSNEHVHQDIFTRHRYSAHIWDNSEQSENCTRRALSNVLTSGTISPAVEQIASPVTGICPRSECVKFYVNYVPCNLLFEKGRSTGLVKNTR